MLRQQGLVWTLIFAFFSENQIDWLYNSYLLDPKLLYFRNLHFQSSKQEKVQKQKQAFLQ